MLNFNNVPQDENPQTQEFSLIPNGTVCRAVVIVQQGDIEISEFGQGQWFKKSQSTSAKWMNLEFTIIGGEYDRRKFWHSVFVDGDKMGQSGMPLAKEIGNISGMFDLNAMELCVKVGIKKGTNGYKDSNQLMVALTPDNKDFLPQGSIPMQNTTIPAQASAPQAPAQPSGAVPSWAQK